MANKMYCIQQMTAHHCFPACLVSFFSDLQIPISQTEIVNRCPKQFNKGKYEEGSISSFYLLKDNTVANEFDIEIKPSPQNIKINKQNSLFLFVRWNNKSSDNHCVRFCNKTTSFTYFMNPTYGKIEHLKSEVFKKWIQLPLLITKT